MEIWKEITGFEGLYEVSSIGNIRSLDRKIPIKNGLWNIKGKVLKLCNDSDGYKIIGLSKNKLRKTYKVHRLVANAFIENTLNKPQVNHINGVKYDNRIDNLEWATNKENMVHAFLIGLKKNNDYNLSLMKESASKKVIDQNSGIIYSSIKDASKALSIGYGGLKSQLRGESKNKTTLRYL